MTQFLELVRDDDFDGAVKMLRSGTVTDFEMETALRLLTVHEDTDMLSTLLEFNVDVNCQRGEEDPPLILACKCGNTEAVHLLLEHQDIDVNARDKMGMTALMHTCRVLNNDSVSALLDTSIDVNAVDDTYQTALHHVSYSTMDDLDVEIAKMLLSHGAQLNIEDDDGETPGDIANERVRKVLNKE